ncbi:MAG: cupin domain-containing protein [Chloroflexi bacterium]|nr:cupin domain-containing protein [Chloroflexota bacterium]
MSRAFTDPKTGDSIRFLRTADETGGALFEVEVTYNPHSKRPPTHYHPRQEERFDVVQGQITAEIGGETRTYRAGEYFIVPPGTHHAMWNAEQSPVVMNWQTRPALRTQQLFESLWGLQQDGKLDSAKPNLLRIAVILNHFRDEFRLAGPSQIVQTLLFPILAVVGRLAGHRAHYEEYSQ